MLQSSNVRRVPASGAALAVSANYTITVPVHKAFADMDTIKALTPLVFPLGVAGGNGGGNRKRGVKLQFFGTGGNNSTVTGVRIYAAHRTEDGQVMLHLLGTAVVTLGNVAGGTNLPFASTEYGADTITWTEDEYYTALRAWMNAAPAAQVVPATPADTLATLFLSDCGGASDLVFDVDLGTATGLGVLAESVT